MFVGGSLSSKEIAFDKCTLPPYTPRKALDRKSFPCHDACIYVFGWNHERGTVKNPKSCEGSLTIPENQPEYYNSKAPEPLSIMMATEDVIETVRSTHLRNAERRVEEQANGKNGGRNKRRKKY